MDVFCPGGGKGPRRLEGILRHPVDGVKLPLAQADYLVILQVNGRQHNHRLSPPKFFKMVSPTSPLFSGWN